MSSAKYAKNCRRFLCAYMSAQVLLPCPFQVSLNRDCAVAIFSIIADAAPHVALAGQQACHGSACLGRQSPTRHVPGGAPWADFAP